VRASFVNMATPLQLQNAQIQEIGQVSSCILATFSRLPISHVRPNKKTYIIALSAHGGLLPTQRKSTLIFA
jgi:hypothetical protein